MRVDPEEASALCDAPSGVLRYAASSVMPSPLLLQPTLAPAAGNRSGGRSAVVPPLATIRGVSPGRFDWHRRSRTGARSESGGSDLPVTAAILSIP